MILCGGQASQARVGCSSVVYHVQGMMRPWLQSLAPCNTPSLRGEKNQKPARCIGAGDE